MTRQLLPLLLCCALAGCGTVQNLNRNSITPYGGTRMACYDWCGGGQNGGFAAAGLWPVWLLDKPFCFVADTVSLPYVLWADGTYRGWWDALTAPRKAEDTAKVDAPLPSPVTALTPAVE